MRKNKNDEIPKSDFDVNESQDLLCFDSTENLGECVATFNFGNSSNADLDIRSNKLSINNNETNNIEKDKTMVLNDNSYSNNKNDINNSYYNTSQELFDNRTTPIANGAAPLIEGEVPDIKRTYMLRASTVRKLNELKSIHPDINVCVSTIVDIALDYYYKSIVKEGKSQ